MGEVQAHTEASTLQPSSRAETSRPSPPGLTQRVSHEQWHPHSWDAPLTSPANTVRCGAKLAVFLSLGAPACSGQDTAAPICRARLARHTRPVHSELQAPSLPRSVATGVGLLSCGPASASPLVPQAGQGRHQVGTRQTLPAQPPAPSQLGPAPPGGGAPFTFMLILKYSVLHFPTGGRGGLLWWVALPSPHPLALPRRCLECLCHCSSLWPRGHTWLRRKIP